MPTIPFDRRYFDAHVIACGADPAAAEACVVGHDEGRLLVDVTHPAYPRRNSTSAIRPPARTYTVEHGRWRWLHDTLAEPVQPEQRPAVWSEITRLADGMACSCSSHWSDLLAANPIDWDDAEAWGVRVHNDVNRRLGKRHDWTVEQARQSVSAVDA